MPACTIPTDCGGCIAGTAQRYLRQTRKPRAMRQMHMRPQRYANARRVAAAAILPRASRRGGVFEHSYPARSEITEHRPALSGALQRMAYPPHVHRIINSTINSRAVCKTAPAHGGAAATSTQVLVATKVARLCRARLVANRGRMPGLSN
jgi:hypothetical protein